MLETFPQCLKVEDLRKKIIYTLIMLLIYRVGSVIPTPGVNVDYIAQQVNNISMLGMLDFINGQNFSNFTIFAMGISPYITSSDHHAAADHRHSLSGASPEGRRGRAA